MMFQRFGPAKSDEELGSFYGLAMPLLKRGIPVEPVQIETAKLDRYRVLLLTYEGQKPPDPKFHEKLTDWVKAGGALVVVDDDKDPFNKVAEWWNTGASHLATPRHHLFDQLGLAHDATGVQRVGKGAVLYTATSPAGLTKKAGGAERLLALAKQAAGAVNVEWKESPALVLRRGPYIVAAGLDEGVSGAAPPTITGRLIPLFDSNLPVVKAFTVTPGSRALLVDVDAALNGAPAGIIAAACRVTAERVTDDAIRFQADGIDASNTVICVKLPAAPKEVTVGGKPLEASAQDYADGVLRIRFVNSATPVSVVIVRR
jgi:hypothetical protein